MSLEYELTIKMADTMATIARHKYWSEQLYKKRLPKRKDLDMAEILTAISNSVAFNLGIYVRPMGSVWASPCTKEKAEEYLNTYKDIWEDYVKWQWEQR